MITAHEMTRWLNMLNASREAIQRVMRSGPPDLYGEMLTASVDLHVVIDGMMRHAVRDLEVEGQQ
jgi:hypothetical protein